MTGEVPNCRKASPRLSSHAPARNPQAARRPPALNQCVHPRLAGRLRSPKFRQAFRKRAPRLWIFSSGVAIAAECRGAECCWSRRRQDPTESSSRTRRSIGSLRGRFLGALRNLCGVPPVRSLRFVYTAELVAKCWFEVAFRALSKLLASNTE